jgi:hypothetical protein
MKNIPHILQPNPRHQSDSRTPRVRRNFPQTDQSYQSSSLSGGCGTPVEFHPPAFFEISSDYFAGEAARSFAIDSGVFAALMVTAILPIINGVQAVAALIHSVGVL